MSVLLSCPSCNTRFDLPGPPATGRATCPRCGDVFPARGVNETASRDREGAGGAPQPLTRPAAPEPRGRTARIAVVLLLLAVAVGLTVYYTRIKPKSPESPLAAPTPPGQLAGLGYLPAECNVVFAVQPGPLVAFAGRRKQEPREVLSQAGIPPQVVAVLDQVGLTLLDIDHIVGGVHVGDEGDELRVALVLVLNRPLVEEDEFLQKLKAKPLPNKAARWSIDLRGLPLLQVLARVSPTVWVLGLNERDLAATDRGGFGPSGAQFRGTETEGLRGMLASVPPDAATWVAADDERDWTSKPLVKLAQQSRELKQWVPAVKGGRGGLVAVSLGEPPKLNLVVRATDPETAERTRAYLQARAAETPGATAGGDGTRARFEAPFDPATSWQTLQRFLEDARR